MTHQEIGSFYVRFNNTGPLGLRLKNIKTLTKEHPCFN